MAFQIGDSVLYTRFPNSPGKEGVILAIEERRAYVHFKGCDKRLDVWAQFANLTKITERLKRRRCEADDDQISKGIDVRNIESVTMGDYLMSAWYFSPYDESFIADKHVYVCDHCLMYFARRSEYLEHSHSVASRRPPCTEIYRCGNLSLFETSPTNQKFFCQCVCLLGKLFLNEMAVCYDVTPYLFYVLCECDELGAHVVGFFCRTAKWSDFNICSSLVVLPPFQRKGYGSLLIRVMYHLAKMKGTFGGPERPLNDLGKAVFESYWRRAIVSSVVEYGLETIEEIVKATGIAENDVIRTLTQLEFLFQPSKELNIDAIEKYVETSKEKLRFKIDFKEENCLWFAEK